MRILSRTAAVACRFALVACLFALAACHARFDRFAFEASEPGNAARAIELRESPGAPQEREGLLGPSRERRSTPLYRLAKPVTVGAADIAFVIGYVSDIDSLELTVFEDRGKPLFAVNLPPTADLAVRRQTGLTPGSRIWGFRIGAGPGGGSFWLRGAGIEPLVHGFRFDRDGLTVDGSLEAIASSPGLLRASLSAGLRRRMTEQRWQLEIEIPGGEAAIGLSTPKDSSTVSASFAVAGDGPRRVILHEGSVGFLPRDLRVRGEPAEGGPAALAVTVSSVPERAPLPADPGLVLDWRRSSWRDPEAEAFAWPRLPGVLIFDTATYEVQERFFRRLAFFVEKPGTAGTLPALEEVEGRRSWNAHDYRAEDLARFFTLAAAGPLTAEESRLREVLLENGVLRASGNSYEPGAGAVISISRESPDPLRELLLTHEAFHGVFFALPAYRQACRAAWDALDANEQRIWLAFLDLKEYNTADPYLVVNEFQSYLFQQERAEVPAFQAVTLRRVRDAFPALGPAAERIERDRPGSFLEAFDALDRALAAAGGPPGGRVLGVRRAGP